MIFNVNIKFVKFNKECICWCMNFIKWILFEVSYNVLDIGCAVVMC